MYHVALCCNGSLLPGLHATLASLTQHLGKRNKVSLHLFLSNVDEASQEDLRQTVIAAGGVGHFEITPADAPEFNDLESLHGDRTVYLRLKLADLLPQAPVILYLDSDLAVRTDVCEFFAIPLGDNPLGAISNETVFYSLDRDNYLKLGLSDEDRCLNSGVLLINADVWRRTRVAQRAVEFAQQNLAYLKSHDQTILNVLFARTYLTLPLRFNHMLAPGVFRVSGKNEIYHFCGSPKPWDPLGSILHRNAWLWDEAIHGSHFSWAKFLRLHARAYIARTWSLRFSYARVTYRRLRWIFWNQFRLKGAKPACD